MFGISKDAITLTVMINFWGGTEACHLLGVRLRLYHPVSRGRGLK